MNGTCHKIAGAVSGITLLYITESSPDVSMIVFSGILGAAGALLPDIDEPSSTIGQKVHLLSSGLKSVFGHRGILHTPFFLAFIWLASCIFVSYIIPDY